jgi:signal transduction histidine kinase
MLALGQSVAVHSPTSTAVFSALVLLLVGVSDYLTGTQLSFGVFYMVPVSFAAWFAGQKTGTAIGIFAGAVWLAADLASATHVHPGAALWNIAARVSVFVFVVQILAHIRGLHLGLEETVTRRTRQLKAETIRRLEMEHEIAAVSHREQQRIAHELHDGLGQELGALAFQAKLLAGRLNQSGSALAKEAETLVRTLNQSTGRTRALSHLLDPVGEGTGALRHALGRLADESGQAFGIACTFDSPSSLPHLSPEAELNLYRITQESIHNAVHHGHASEIVICAKLEPHLLTLSISDNGCGFPLDTKPAASSGMGLRIMRYRSDALRARLQLRSAPGQGCSILCSLPLD